MYGMPSTCFRISFPWNIPRLIVISCIFTILLTGCSGGGNDGNKNQNIKSGNGSSDTPYIASMPLRHSRSIGSEQLIFYLVTQPANGTFTSNLITHSGDTDLYIADIWGGIICSSLGTYAASESCQFDPPENEFVLVIAGYEPSNFTLTVDSSPPIDGTWGNPYSGISPYTISGDLSALDARYYQIDLQQNLVNFIQLTSPSVDMALARIPPNNYEDPEFMCGSYEGSPTVKTCNVVNPSDIVLVEASSEAGGSYTLQTETTPLVGQGSLAAPYILSSPFWFEDSMTSHEQLIFSTLVPSNDPLGVSLIGLSNNADLTIQNSIDDSVICESLGRKNADESCLVSNSNDLNITVSAIDSTKITLMSQPNWEIPGTWGNPVSSSLPFSSQTNFSQQLPFYYQIDGISQSIFQATGTGRLSLWDSSSGNPLCAFSPNKENSCIITPKSGEIFVEVDSLTFDLNMAEAISGDGTFYSPFIGTTPYSQTDSAELYGHKFHAVAVTPGVIYRVNFAPDNNYGWGMKVYDGMETPTWFPYDYLQSKTPMCTWVYSSRFPDCYIQSNSGLAFIELNGGAATAYSLSIEEVVPGNGSATSPYLHDWPVSGILKFDGSLAGSQYRYDMTWIPSGNYTISFEPQNSNDRIEVNLNNQSYTTCSSSGSSVCTIQSSGSMARIEFYSYNPSSFTFSIRKTSEVPQQLPISGAIPYSDVGTVASNSSVFYHFTTTRTGHYQINLGNLNADADLYVFGRTQNDPDPLYYPIPPQLLCSSFVTGVSNKSCDFTTDHTDMVIVIQASDATGFSLDVNAPLGSIDNPYVGNPPYEHNHAPSTADRVHYQIAVTPGNSYLITAKSSDGLSVLDGDIFVCNSYQPYCFATPTTASMMLRISPKIVTIGENPTPYQLQVKGMAIAPYASMGDIQAGQAKQGSLVRGEAIAYNLNAFPDVEYTVSLSGLTNDGDLIVNNYAGLACSSRQSGNLDETCILIGTNSPIELIIYAYEATDFALTVSAPLGSIANPIQGTIPFSLTKMLPASEILHYQLPTIPGAGYLISLSRADGSWVNIDFPDNNSLWCPFLPNGKQECLFVATGDSFVIQLWYTTGVETSIQVIQTVSNTAASPIAGEVPYTISAALLAEEVAYYSLPALHYQQYDFSLTNLTGNADMYVFRGQGGRLMCAQRNAGTLQENCSFYTSHVEPGEAIFNLLVAVQAKTGTSYSLQVTAP